MFSFVIEGGLNWPPFLFGSLYLILYAFILHSVWKAEDAFFDQAKEKFSKPMTLPTCSFCKGELFKFMDFGYVALAGGFLKKENFSKEKKYPLRLCFCSSCFSVQLADRIPADVMFKDYLYFSSATQTIKRHFAEYAKEIVERFNPKTVIEVGCNDGVLLRPLKEAGIKVIGVDPSNTVESGNDIVNEYFTEEVAERIGKADVIVANNVFAHIDDIHEVTRAVVKSMKQDSVFVVEVHYLGGMLEGLQYDWIYHEHIYYYSLISIEKHFKNYGLNVFDVKRVNTHGGSIRFYIGYNQKVSQAVIDLRNDEVKKGLCDINTYLVFSARIRKHKEQIRSLLSSLKGKIAGYGASGRANALIQYCGVKVDYIVDDAPAKQGLYTPGSHIPIVTRSEFDKNKPSHVIAFAWSYADEIQKKCGLPLIIPLPEIKTLESLVAA